MSSERKKREKAIMAIMGDYNGRPRPDERVARVSSVRQGPTPAVIKI